MKTAEEIREEIIDKLDLDSGYGELLEILTTWKEDICKKAYPSKFVGDAECCGKCGALINEPT